MYYICLKFSICNPKRRYLKILIPEKSSSDGTNFSAHVHTAIYLDFLNWIHPSRDKSKIPNKTPSKKPDSDGHLLG